MISRLSLYGQAVTLALIGYLSFSIADISAKILSVRHPVVLCLFIPATIALIGMVIRILIERGPSGFKTNKLKLHVLRGCSITAMVTLCVHSLKLIPIADFYSIIFLSPFVVMAFSIIVYKEAIHWPRILVLLLSFAGVIITIGPHFYELNIGYVFISCAVFFSAINIFLVRKIGREEYSPLFGLFPITGIVLTSAPFAIPDLTIDVPFNDLWIFLIYGLALIIGHNFLPMAFSRTPSVSRLTPLHYSQMIWGILAGIFIFKTPPEINIFIGGGLIIGSGLWLFYYETFSSKKTI